MRGCAAVAFVTALVTSTALGSGRPATAQTPPMGAVDEAQSAGLGLVIRTFSVTSGDFNEDGYPDLLVIPHDPDSLRQGITNTTIPYIYRNNGGTYSDVNNGRFGARDRHGCTFADVNRDARLDFFCTDGFGGRYGKELGIQQPDGTFRDQAGSMNLYQSGAGRYRNVAVFDANGDGYPDVYLTRYYGPNGWKDGPSPAEDPPNPNELYLSDRGRSFDAATSFGLTQPIGAPKDAASCVQPVDYDHDGRTDLMVCGYKKLVLYHNDNNAGFSDVGARMGIFSYAIDAQMVDLNGDGQLDLVRLKSDYLAIRFGNSSGWSNLTFGQSLDGGGQALAVGDFNGDGRPDIYVVRSCPTAASRSDKADAIYLNEGNGNFTPMSIPALPHGGGCGDAVAATDYDRDGHTDFVVTNGHKKVAGPLQLWSWKPLS